jgi:Ribbon-helix-helix protein, copG family.
VRVVTFKLDDYLIDLINTLSIKYKISRSEFIRRALIHYIKYLESDNYVRVRAYELR